ncbi:MAG: LicD family protein [Tatlockia sp.]|nr:LicD family protein [Tatlockia sp.]
MEQEAYPSAQNAQFDGRLRQAQLKMLFMLEQIDKVCQKHCLDYWLEGGTLLGAIRHQGFIPWDDDLDISMPRESYEAFLRLAPSELPDTIWLQTAQTDPGYFNLTVPLKVRDCHSRFIEFHETGKEPYQQGIFIDVFVYDKMDENAFRRKQSKFIAKKILRLLRPKYSHIATGHYANLYSALSRLIAKRTLENLLKSIIQNANQGSSRYLGYGFDGVNSNFVSLDDIYPLKRTTFETGQFNIINQPEVILTQLYGDFLSLPPEEDRVMKHCRELIPDLNGVL